MKKNLCFPILYCYLQTAPINYCRPSHIFLQFKALCLQRVHSLLANKFFENFLPSNQTKLNFCRREKDSKYNSIISILLAVLKYHKFFVFNARPIPYILSDMVLTTIREFEQLQNCIIDHSNPYITFRHMYIMQCHIYRINTFIVPLFIRFTALLSTHSLLNCVNPIVHLLIHYFFCSLTKESNENAIVSIFVLNFFSFIFYAID